MTTAVWPNASKASRQPTPNSPDDALALFAAAHAIRDTYGVAASVPERTETGAELEALRAVLDTEAFTTMWNAGSNMKPEEAVAKGLRPGINTKPPA